MVKLSKLIMIFDLRRQGLSISAIARKTGLCRKTVRQHLERGLSNPVYEYTAEREASLLLSRLTARNRQATELMQNFDVFDFVKSCVE